MKLTEKLYRCVGENYMPYCCDLGFCGDTHTLKAWIEILFADDEGYTLNLLSKYTEHAIVEYIRIHRGKTLLKVK